jgi:hypothetical protein
MKVLTVRQPYATAILTGQKKIETRKKPTKERGTIAIHAGVYHDLELSNLRVYYNITSRPFDLSYTAEHVYGAIIGFVDIVDCVGLGFIDGLSRQEMALGDFVKSRYGYVLENPRFLKTPIYNVRGQLGFWNYEVSE